MARTLTASILAALAVSVAGVALAAGVPANITAALADKSRPEADV
jgi:predicted methyltransferase